MVRTGGRWKRTVLGKHLASGLPVCKLRGKQLIGKPGRTRRYHVPPAAARIITALLTLRDHVIAPILAGVADPRIRRTPRHWTDIDRHYQALRLEMMALFADIGIACG